MTPLLAFVIRNYIWILALCTLGAIWNIVQLIQGQRHLQRTRFSLERERAFTNRNTSLTWLLVLSIVGGGALYARRNLSTLMPTESLSTPQSTPESGSFAAQATPIRQLTPRAELPTPTQVIAPTATLRNPENFNVEFTDPQSTPIVALDVETVVEGCLGDALIRQPRSGATLSGGVSFFGRASAENFGYYRFDIIGPFTNDGWQPLIPDQFSQPVNEGFLASADLSAYETGVYQIRLSVFDGTNNLAHSCLIQIGISN